MKTVIEVNQSNMASVVETLSAGVKGFDTETTGVGYYDRPFLLTIAKGEETFYFDLSVVIPPQDVLLGKNYSHNAKFDAIMLSQVGLTMPQSIHCTMVAERLIRNDRLPGDYSLDKTAKRYGLEKDNRVDEYIKALGLYEVRQVDEKTEKVPQFHKVPKELMKEYACQDAWLHLQIGLLQEDLLEEVI